MGVSSPKLSLLATDKGIKLMLVDRHLRDCVFVDMQIEVQSAYFAQVYTCQVIKCT